MQISDSSGLHITHVGSSDIKSPSNKLHLHNVLCVPTIKSNLISLANFTKLTMSLLNFPRYFSVKDLSTRAGLLQGKNRDNVYVLPQSSTPTVHNTSVDWHHRLGHPPIKTFLIDGGTEYVKLKELFATHGISHLTSPSYTPQHKWL